MPRKTSGHAVFGPNKYAAFHLLLGKWIRTCARDGAYCYVTLGGTELRDIVSLNFIDADLATPAISFEEIPERHALAQETAGSLRDLGVVAATRKGNLFDFKRESESPHLFFIDLQGACSGADYPDRFAAMFQDATLREGDSLFITSYLGRNSGWKRLFSLYQGEFQLLKATDFDSRRLLYRRYHPSFTLFKGLDKAGLRNQLSIRCLGSIEYHDSSTMAVFGYSFGEGSTDFLDFIRDKGIRHFDVAKGFCSK